MTRNLTAKQRLYAGLILVMFMLLLLAANRMNRLNFSTVENSVKELFEDRVMAQEYIYQLNNLFHIKEINLTSADWKTDNAQTSQEIIKLLSDFSHTKLTREEFNQFKNLRNNYAKLVSLEHILNEGHYSEREKARKSINGILFKINGNLDRLSDVQLAEGRYLTKLSQKTLGVNNLLAELEVVFLIIIGFLMASLIYRKDRPVLKLVQED